MASDFENYAVTEHSVIPENSDVDEEDLVGIDVTFELGGVEQDVGKFIFEVTDESLPIWDYIGEETENVRDGTHRGEIFAGIATQHPDCYAITGRNGADEETAVTIGTDRGESVHFEGSDIDHEDIARFRYLSIDFELQHDGLEFFDDGNGSWPVIDTRISCHRLETYYYTRARLERRFCQKTDDPVRRGLKRLWQQRAESASETADEIGEIKG